MSRSPRTLLRSAAEALDAIHELCERHPEARDEIVSALGGPDQLAVVEAARQILRGASGEKHSAAGP